MITFYNPEPSVADKKDVDWYERIIKAGLLIVGIVSLSQDRQSWFPYVFLLVLILLTIPSLKGFYLSWKSQSAKKKVLRQFVNDFRSYIDQGCKFAQDSNVNCIPYNLRDVLKKMDPMLASFSSSVESILWSSVRHLHSNAKVGYKSYKEFEMASEQFSDLMSSLVLSYVDQIVRELNKAENRAKVTDAEIANLKKRYDSFFRFIENYNAFRSRIAHASKQQNASFEIRTPYEVLK